MNTKHNTKKLSTLKNVQKPIQQQQRFGNTCGNADITIIYVLALWATLWRNAVDIRSTYKRHYMTMDTMASVNGRVDGIPMFKVKI